MFNPQEHLSIVDGAAYLEVKWRLVWLREAHPDASVDTTMVESSMDHAIFRAEVRIPDGGSATGWGSEFREHFPNYVEAAETKAIGRALAALGFGTQFAGELSTDQGEYGRSDASVPTRLIQDEDAPVVKPAPIQADATDRQKKLIALLQRQLEFSNSDLDEVARTQTGSALDSLNRSDASALITELQRQKQERESQRAAS